MTFELFLKPRLTGTRFEGGVLPLHVLTDFAVFEQLVIDVAKWRFKVDHPERQRIPRGFTDGISLKLTGLEEGSAKPVISLCFAATNLFQHVAIPYFEEARTAIVEAVHEAEQGQQIRSLPQNFLGYFGRFGRSLEAGEAIEFTDTASGRTARMNQETRHRLVIASTVKEYTEDIVLHGTIPEMDQKNNCFHVLRIDGTMVKAPLTVTHFDPVFEAFKSYSDGQRVRLYASGVFDRDRRLKAIDTIDQVIPIDHLDVRWRVEELKTLRPGWLEGKGLPPDHSGLDWLADAVDANYPDDLRLPYLFPTPNGRVLAEWSMDPWSPSLDVDLETKQASWHALNLSTDEEITRDLNLSEPDDWLWLVKQLRGMSEATE